jgi:hypothetical protein
MGMVLDEIWYYKFILLDSAEAVIRVEVSINIELMRRSEGRDITNINFPKQRADVPHKLFRSEDDGASPGAVISDGYERAEGMVPTVASPLVHCRLMQSPFPEGSLYEDQVMFI